MVDTPSMLPFLPMHAKSKEGPKKIRLATIDTLDQRTAAARRCKETIAALETDLGGAEALSEAQRQLVQRAAVLGTFIEDCETLWLGTGKVGMSEYLSAINVQRRVLATLGMDRKAKDVTPDLHEYMQKGG